MTLALARTKGPHRDGEGFKMMEQSEQLTPTAEHDELIDMRTHLTVAVLAAAQLRRSMKDVPDAARVDCYLDHALKDLVEDVRKVDELVAQAEAQVPALDCTTAPTSAMAPKKMRLPTRLVRAVIYIIAQVVGACCGWVQRRKLMRRTALALYS